MHLRKENLAIVTREIAEDRWVTNLDSTKSRAVSWCKCCRENKPLGAFYLKSKQDRKHPNDVRSYCCICFDKQVKKSRDIREQKHVDNSLNTLFAFFE